MTAHLIINHWLVRWFNSILHLFTHHPTTSCGSKVWMHRLRGLFFHFRIILRRRRTSSICSSVYSFCPNTSRPFVDFHFNAGQQFSLRRALSWPKSWLPRPATTRAPPRASLGRAEAELRPPPWTSSPLCLERRQRSVFIRCKAMQ